MLSNVMLHLPLGGAGVVTIKAPDAAGDIHGRDAYDNEDAGFVYADSSVTPAVLYVRVTETPGTWSAPIPWQGPAGPEGPHGAPGGPGPAGADGSKIIAIKGTPSDATGTDGDLAWDAGASILYQKVAGSWNAGTDLKGADGRDGGGVSITTNDWGIGSSLAAGVTAEVGSTSSVPSGTDIALKLGRVGSTTGRWSNNNDDLAVAPAEADGTRVVVIPSKLGGDTSVQQFHEQDQEALQLMDHTTAPALQTGTYTWVHFPKIKLINDTLLRLRTAQQATPATSSHCLIDLSKGTVDSIPAWGMSTYLRKPTDDDIKATHLGDGIYSLTIRLECIGNGAIPWFILLLSSQNATGINGGTFANDGSDRGIEFVQPTIIANSKDAAFGSSSDETYYFVNNTSFGTHQKSLPVVLQAKWSVTPDNRRHGALLCIHGSSSGGGSFVTRLIVSEDGQLQLRRSQDGDEITATLKNFVFSQLAGKTVAMRVTEEEVVIFVDGFSLMGLPVTEPPTDLHTFAINADATGHPPGGGVVSSGGTADGLKVVSDLNRLMTVEELTVLNDREMALSGRQYMAPV